jgi:hypothetical protein
MMMMVIVTVQRRRSVETIQFLKLMLRHVVRQMRSVQRVTPTWIEIRAKLQLSV